MSYAIEVNNVFKKYEGFCLNHINIKVPKGTIMGFVGENGAGKTTTIKAMLNLISTDEGDITILDRSSTAVDKSMKYEIGVVFDENYFHENFNIKEIKKILKAIYKDKWEEDTFHDYLVRFKLPENKIIKEFSKGMKMKLSIATALSHDAKLLILDEATSGLDPVTRDEILDIFMEFIQNEENTVFLSSHITSDLEKVADYITFIHEGEIVFSECKDDLLYNYGVIRCTYDEFQKLDRTNLLYIRKNNFGCEILIKNRSEEEKKHAHIVDKTNIEEIMLFMIKGEEL